ncbi:MAG: hypothetical protein R3Y68_03560 [Rikenellaceae bacterium]
MKNILKYMLLALPLLVGCESDEASFVDPYEVDPNAACELSYTLDGTFSNGDGGYLAIQNNYITLDNTSTGLYTQSWIISSTDCQFMVDGFDSEADLAEQADVTKGVASTRALDYLYCPTLGTYTLTLNCAFVGETAGATYSASADLWIYKKSFTVEVQECPALSAVPKIYDTDGVTEITATDLEINPGKTLYLKSESEGLDIVSESWSVKIDGVETELTLADDGSYTFVEEGVYSDFTLAVESSNILYGEESTSKATLPQSIKVESIQLDVTAISLDISGSVSHSSSELPEIKVTLNGVVDDIVDVVDDFTLTVTDYANATQTIVITSVELDSTKGALILKLDGKIYENDTVTLSYTKDEEIIDKYNDTNILESFDEVVITISGGVDLLGSSTDYDFETGTTGGANGWTLQSWSGSSIDTTTASSGSNSLLFNDYAGKSDGFRNGGSASTFTAFCSADSAVSIPVPKGNYLLEHDVYVSNGVTEDAYYVTKSRDDAGTSWVVDKDSSSSTINYHFPEAGSWSTQRGAVCYSADMNLKYSFLFYSYANDTALFETGAKFWVDNFKLIPIR